MRKGKRTPALPGVVFCPALEKILSVRLKGQHCRGSAPMFINTSSCSFGPFGWAHDSRGKLLSPPRCARCRPLIYEPFSLRFWQRAMWSPGCYLQREAPGAVHRSASLQAALVAYSDTSRGRKKCSRAPIPQREEMIAKKW